MAEFKHEEGSTDDSAPSTEVDDDDVTELSKNEKSYSDEDVDEDDGDLDYYSDEEELDDDLTLDEQLQLERENLKEAKLRIANLITQITEYQHEMDQNRQELEQKIKAVTQQHADYEELLQSEIDEQRQELEQLQSSNSDLKKKNVLNLQTILNEMRELEQKNAEYQKQLVESRQAGSIGPNGQVTSGLSIGNEQLNKILSMLQHIHSLCQGNHYYVPPVEELFATEKKKLEEEQRTLEHQLVLAREKKEEALGYMYTQQEHEGAIFLKQIDDTKKMLEREKVSAHTARGQVITLNNRLVELKQWCYESNNQLMQERNQLTIIEDKIKELRQQIKPLQIQAKAMQIDNAESIKSDSMTGYGSDGKSESEPPATDLVGSMRTSKLGLGGTIRGSLSRNPSRLTRANSDAHFLRMFDPGQNEENLSPGRDIAVHQNRYLMLSDPPLPGLVNCMLVVNKLVWVGCSDGTIRLYDKDTARIVADLTREPASAVFCMEIVARDVWTGHKDGIIKIWTANGTFREEFEAHSDQVTAISRVGTSVWSIGKDKYVLVWDSKTRRQLRKKLTDAFLLCMCYDGFDTVWIGADSQIVRWDSKKLKKMNTLTKHTKFVHHLTVVIESNTTLSGNSGRTMWSCSSDNTICVWDIVSYQGMRGMVDFGGEVWCSSYNRVILRIDKKTHSISDRYEEAHGDAISALVVVPDDCGSRVWTGSWDKRVSIWKNDNPIPRVLTAKQKAILTMSWRQLFNGTNGTILSDNCDVVETSSALGVIGKLVS